MVKDIVKLGFLFFLIGFSNEGYTGMFGFLKKVDVFLCPEVHGTIKMRGEPLSGVKIMREIIYDDEIVDRTITSEAGEFSFDTLKINSRTPNKAFDETRARQVIVADYNGRRYLLWLHITDSIDEEPLISEKLRNLNCDLENEEKYHHFPRSDSSDMTYNIKSICRW